MINLHRLGRLIRRLLSRTIVVLSLMVFVWLVAAGGFAFFEHKSYWDALWWASVTGSTVGYGDFFPVTLGGRLVGLWFIGNMFILNIFLSALIVSAVIVDKNVYGHVEQEQTKGMLFLLLRDRGLISKDAKEPPTLEELRAMGYNAIEEESE